ncbi:MAG: acyl-CoA dehydratase activase, partial [Spirochaetota bacterium]
MKKIGIDIGSLYLSAVVIEDDKITESLYWEHRGDITAGLSTFLSKPAAKIYDRIGLTGNVLSRDGLICDGILSTVEGIQYLVPGCRNAISIGGESFSIIFFEENGQYKEHAINPPCAAGTGSFIEQQAERLSISVSDLAQRASTYSGKTPFIATRCAVFAKTDITHAMQEGYSLDAICSGLCEGIARNILDTLIKGRTLHSPIVITGGVSLNAKIINTIREITGKEVVVPVHAENAGAIGAALLGKAEEIDPEELLKPRDKRRNVRRPLEMKLTHYPDFKTFTIYTEDNVEVFLPKKAFDIDGGVFLGIDIGSTSTKAVIINSNKEIAGGFYTATGGSPIAAVQKIIGKAKSTYLNFGNLKIEGVCTTGSGRKMIKELFSADMEINEITAHAKAAVFLNPKADTIIEIGGQDSKFTRIRDGEVYFSTMNYVCAAGTGSFIEEQAKRLGVNLSLFSEMAMKARAPYTSDRCTVYMERDLGELLSEGWSKESLAASVLNSVRDNYMAKVVNKSHLGDYIVFQGATARNRALVAAFEQLLDKPIHVSPYCHLTGALGAALLGLESGRTGSRFILEMYALKPTEEVCTKCVNHCLLTIVAQNQKVTGWGMKCGKDYHERTGKTPAPSGPEKRFRALCQPFFNRIPPLHARNGITIGLPLALYNAAYAPLWHDFLTRLGFKVIVSEVRRAALAQGKEIVNSDFCAPMVISHGYIQQLLEKKVDFIFYPAIVNEENPDSKGDLLFKKKTKDAY